MLGMRSIGTWPGAALAPAGRDADADEREAAHDADGDPDDRPGRTRYRGMRSPAAREHRRRRWRERRAPVSAANNPSGVSVGQVPLSSIPGAGNPNAGNLTGTPAVDPSDCRALPGWLTVSMRISNSG